MYFSLLFNARISLYWRLYVNLKCQIIYRSFLLVSLKKLNILKHCDCYDQLHSIYKNWLSCLEEINRSEVLLVQSTNPPNNTVGLFPEEGSSYRSEQRLHPQNLVTSKCCNPPMTPSPTLNPGVEHGLPQGVLQENIHKAIYIGFFC